MMGEANPPARYDLPVILFHWFTLLLVGVIYLTIEVQELLPLDSGLRSVLEDWHGYLGFVLLPIAVVRLLYVRRQTAPPVRPSLSAWQSSLTLWMKKYLYFLILGMPLSGWIFLSADGAMINFWAFPLPQIAPENQGLAQLAARIHVLLGVSGYLFISIHAAAGLFHHYIIKNNVLSRMAPWLKR